MQVYGPVPSRRFGQSLGIDLIPPKICNYSCIYCQLGRTLNYTNERRSWFSKEDILKELVNHVKKVGIDTIDYITIVGDGEPTLSLDLGWMISEVKKRFSVPVAVITNGALLSSPQVRLELKQADVVSPTFDAADEEMFKKVNRPYGDLRFNKIIDGMVQFRKEYSGEIWIEIMVMDGINDGDTQIMEIKESLKDIKPDRIYINVPIRPPAESYVKIPSISRIYAYKDKLGNFFDITLPEEGSFALRSDKEEDILRELIEIIKRHPMRKEQILEILEQKRIDDQEQFMNNLTETNEIEEVSHRGCVFIEWKHYKRG
ncbi:MAG: radical SAM protein [Candidatus Lokiarchaeota archaeon]|nr:radical SAM protein [Candidatus Lokiarchaeota archaeon]